VHDRPGADPTGLRFAAALIVLLGALAAWLRARSRRARTRTHRALIAGFRDFTTVDRASGSVRSVQTAELVLDRAALEEIWSPAHLERLARTYWRFLTRVTLGVIRVHYTASGRSVVLLVSPLKLLTFHAPEYELDASRGLVRWRIAKGLLVARQGREDRGYLQIEVRRAPLDPRKEHRGEAGLQVEVEVANFYPWIASRFGRRLYEATQARLHVLITRGFLRSLTRLDLAESRVGRFAASPRG